MPFTIIRQDITKMYVDGIVNAANTQLQMGGGVCGAIFKAAGVYEMQAACDKLAPVQTGDAVITPGFKLPARYVIHAAGPVYRDGKSGEEEHLRSCYMNSLNLAAEIKCESIAFPLISSGIYGYPKDEALRVATAAIQDFLADHDIEVYLAVFDKEELVISEKLLGETVETSIEGILIFNEDYRITFANEKMASILGYSIDEMLGRPYGSFFPKDQQDIYNYQASLRKEGKDSVYECRLLRMDGQNHWFLVSAKAIQNELGEFEGSFAMLTDINN